MKEIKVLSDFDIDKEKQFMGLSIDDFYFHVMVKKAQTDG